MANPRMTAEIGRVLGGRYRLVAPIGMGASAQVYLADDVKLRRRVAVKMLHDALADDAEFIRRFRAEARAAAALSHPNVMAVYDWSDGGGEGESAFIVTEYLPGGSLRTLLDAGSLLSTSQALEVGLQAARALDYAHRRGFVHRDIKPANLLFGEEQRLRIADFGLARALAEAAWTEPQGAVLGTARYASPEQAKGEGLSGKADVYSLGLVIIEAVTGAVPFTADTTLGMLMARVDKPVPVPEELGPLVEVLEGAGRPDPDERIDARALAKGLLRAAGELSRPAPLPLVGALAAGTTTSSDLDPTVHAPSPIEPAAKPTDLTADDLELDPPHWVNQADPPSSMAAGAAGVAGATAVAAVAGADAAGTETPGVEAMPAGEGEDIDSGAGGDGAELAEAGAVGEAGAEATEATASLNPPEAASPGAAGSSMSASVDTAEVVAIPGAASDDVLAEEGPGETRRGRRWPWVVLAIAVVAAVVVGAVALLGGGGDEDEIPVVLPLPDLVGRTEQQATSVLAAGGWEVEITRERRDGSTKGEVLATDPGAGTRVPDGDVVALTVSEGQTIAPIPTDLAGKAFADAEAALEKAGFGAAVSEEVFDEEVPDGVVVRVAEGMPAELEKGTTVGLVVSKGPEPRTIPGGLAGKSEDEVSQILSDLGLEVAFVRTFSDSVDEGVVISTLPTAGSTAAKGSTVSVEVSRGPELVEVPSIASAGSINEAVAILAASGLNAGSVSGPASGTPVGTSPAAGTPVRVGSTVDIILG